MRNTMEIEGYRAGIQCMVRAQLEPLLPPEPE